MQDNLVLWLVIRKVDCIRLGFVVLHNYLWQMVLMIRMVSSVDFVVLEILYYLFSVDFVVLEILYYLFSSCVLELLFHLCLLLAILDVMT